MFASPSADAYGGAPGGWYGDVDEEALLDEEDGEDEGGKKRRRGWKQRLILTGLGGLILVCLAGIVATAVILRVYGSIERFSDLPLNQRAPGDPINYLIIGNDDRVDGGAAGGGESVIGGRSDSIVIMRVDPQAERVMLLSIPRDLEVPLARGGTFDANSTPDKINHVYNSETGRGDLMLTIQGNFDIDIHNYVEITLGGMERLIDSVGGVEMYFEEPMQDTHSGLYIFEAGCHNLDGETAAAFVRSRYPEVYRDGEWTRLDPTADLGRTTRQQEFIRQAMSKALEEAPTNPAQLLGRIEALADTIGLDDTIRIPDLVDLADQLRSLNPEDENSFVGLGLPVDSGPHTDFKVFMVEDEAEPILNVFRGLDPGDLRPGLIPITVLNGTGAEDQALNVAGAFQDIGFPITAIGDTVGRPEVEERPDHTIIYHAAGDRDRALRVARHVSGGAWVVEGGDAIAGEVTVVTGADFETLHELPTDLDDLPDTERPGGPVEGEGDATDDGDGVPDDSGATDDTPDESPAENQDDGNAGDEPPAPPALPDAPDASDRLGSITGGQVCGG